MINRITIVCCFLCAICFQSVVAQSVFANNRLNELFSILPIECKNSINQANNTKCLCKIAGDSIPIKTSFNNEGQINHVGLDLFSLDNNLIFSPSVIGFIERSLLEDLLWNNTAYINKKNKEDRIQLFKNNKALGEIGFSKINGIIPIIKNEFAFSLKQEGLEYTAVLENMNGKITIIFPATNAVISGMDKKEYGEQVMASLKTIKNYANFIPKTPLKDQLKTYKDDIKVSVGNSYFKSITSTKYYKVTDVVIEPLFSREYPLESFCNIFLMPMEANKKIQLNITHKIYGDEKFDYKVNLNDFISFFGTDFEFYFGIEEKTDESMSGTLIIFNRKLNFVNLLYVNTNKNTLLGNNPIINAKLYTNIPSDNIKNLFADYDSSNTTKK
ncbi:hypothetical protein [Flavobacterium cheonanense]|uniref:hypothetical protein n=1 Tax=Flavobacterium cheonanense TaxID=706183 RepID=UPI0031D3A62E